jgi:hypothetical protein
MRTITRRAVLTLAALLSLSGVAARAAAEAKTVRLVSGYPVDAGHGRSVALAVAFTDRKGGAGTLAFDRNTRTFDEFGEVAGTTLLAVRLHTIKLTLVPRADPAGRGRRLYAITGDKLPGTYKLVVPGKAGDVYRLLYSKPGDKGVTAVILLQPWPAKK